MDGVTMTIEVLGRTIMEQNKELDKRQETIDKLNRKIKLFEDYIDVYEKCLTRSDVQNGDKN
jgi:uncharacterized coiled-coil protein SlyX